MVEVQAWTPVGLNPSRWCEDPFGRFELRWWDGTAWTARVRSDGWRATDPLGTAPPHTDTAQVAPRDPAQDATGPQRGAMVKVFLRGRDFRAATREGGEIGTLPETAPNSTLVHYIGDDWPWQPGHGVTMLLGPDHICLTQLSGAWTKPLFMVIPKQNIMNWGLLERGSLPMQSSPGASSELVMGLAYGPIGALFGSFTDAADAKKFAEAAKEPVIGIHYRVGEGENAIFLKYSSAHKRQHAEDILSAALTGQHRQ